MPQAPQYLRDLFDDDREAWDVLKGKFKAPRGVISPNPGHTPTVHELLAVDYLCLEWDYGYEPEPAIYSRSIAQMLKKPSDDSA